MRAGDLKKRITFQYQTKVADGMGGFTVSYVDACTVYAAIWPVSASEVVQANSAAMVVSHRIRMRYRSVLKASWRVKFGERYFNIVSIINPNTENKMLDLMVKEAAN
jgi:SPP1 family predicted phage head-tail adaptor